MSGRWSRAIGTIAVVAALVVPASIAGAGTSTAATAKADPSAILRYATDLSTFGGPALDPTTTKGSPLDFSYDYFIYDTLLHVARDGSYTPGLATAWKIVDPQTLDLTLRPNVKFQDGGKLDANAVKAAIDRSIKSNDRSFNPAFFKLDSVTVTGPLALRLHLSDASMEAFFPALHSLATMVPSPNALKKGDLAKNPVGAGPYAFKELVTEDHLSLRKFKGYWDAKGYQLAGVDFIHEGGGEAGGPNSINNLLAGQVDLADLSTTPEAKTLQGRPGVKLYTQAAENNLYLMTMCTTSKPFDKLAVRKAVAMAIDRNAINKGALDGLGAATSLPVGASSAFYFPDLAKQYPYNPAKAKKLLRKAGVPAGTELNFLEPPVPSFLKVTEVVQGQLDAVGFKTHVIQSVNVTQDLFIDNKAPTAVLYTTDPGVAGFLQYLSPTGLANLCHYRNPKVDAAFAAINASFGDATKAKAAWRQLETQLVKDLPLIFLIYPTKIAGFSDKVHGVNQMFETGTVNLRGVFIAKG